MFICVVVLFGEDFFLFEGYFVNLLLREWLIFFNFDMENKI